MNTQRKHRRLTRSLSVALIGGLLALGGVGSALAAPPRWAPAHGERDHGRYDNRYRNERLEHNRYRHAERWAWRDEHRPRRVIVVREYRPVVERRVYVQPVPAYGYTTYSTARYGSAHDGPNLSGIAGAVIGGTVGSTVGKGDGRLAATGVGAVAGYIVGQHVGGR